MWTYTSTSTYVPSVTRTAVTIHVFNSQLEIRFGYDGFRQAKFWLQCLFRDVWSCMVCWLGPTPIFAPITLCVGFKCARDAQIIQRYADINNCQELQVTIFLLDTTSIRGLAELHRYFWW